MWKDICYIGNKHKYCLVYLFLPVSIFHLYFEMVMFYFTTEPTVQPVTSVATLVAPAPSGSLAPGGEQQPADFMDSGEPDPPTGTAAAAPAEQHAAIEATGNTILYVVIHVLS